MTSSRYRLRPATPDDTQLLSTFISREYYLHRHLDWRPPLGWLGYRPFWLMFDDDKLAATLAMPPDPANVAWVRLFACNLNLTPAQAWAELFERARAEIHNPATLIAAIALQSWFSDLLESHHFERYQEIVVLSWNNQSPPARPLPPALVVRAMRLEDLPMVEEIDNLAFEPVWQNSLDAITLAFQQASEAGSATVAELDGQMAGFQISTSTPLATHLARLAVHPDFQRRNIGYALVRNLFGYFYRQGSWQLTVNTQDSNKASLALYQSMGFELTGEQFPVYVYRGS